MLYSLSFDVSKRIKLSPVKYCEFTCIGIKKVLVEVNLTLKGQLETATIQSFTQAHTDRRKFI